MTSYRTTSVSTGSVPTSDYENVETYDVLRRTSSEKAVTATYTPVAIEKGAGVSTISITSKQAAYKAVNTLLSGSRAGGDKK